MKAMVLTGPGEVGAQDRAVPEATASESVVRISHTGICGTDLKIYNGGIPVRYPLVMGHEMIGELVDAGGAEDAKPGDRVIVDAVTFCGNCYQCRAGQQHICPSGQMIGRDRDGGFAEYLKAPAGNIYTLPAEIGDAEAPLIQVMTTCMHAHRRVPVFPGEVVVVTGLGVTGQLHAQIARARGAGTVIGVSRSQWKRDMASRLGADIVAAPGADAEKAVLDASGGRGADVIIEATGMVHMLAEGIDLARIGARMMIFGIYTAQEGRLPFYQFYFKELDMINCRAAKGEDYPVSIDMVRRGDVKLEPLISHVIDLGDIKTALDMLKGDEDGRMKIILQH